MRKIPKKNYLIMAIIVLTVVIVTILFAHIYNKNIKKTSIMYNYLSEIKKKDIDTYIIEKTNIILYVADKYDVSKNKIEKKIKNKLIDYNITNYFVFLHLNTNNASFIDYLNKKYSGSLKQRLPMIIIFEEGKIKKCYYDLENINFNEIIGDIK